MKLLNTASHNLQHMSELRKYLFIKFTCPEAVSIQNCMGIWKLSCMKSINLTVVQRSRISAVSDGQFKITRTTNFLGNPASGYLYKPNVGEKTQKGA